MKTNKEIRIGDLVEIEYTRKVAGYMFKATDDEVTLAPSTDVWNADALIKLEMEDITSIFSHRPDDPKKEKKEEKKDGATVLGFPNGEEVS